MTLPRSTATRALLAGLGMVVLIGLVLTFRHREEDERRYPPRLPEPAEANQSEQVTPLPGEVLMSEYAQPEIPPIEDLRAVHRVVTGYFSIIKDDSRYPIGGNEDLAAALRGENADRQEFLPANHPAFGPEGRLIDRWGTPLFVHPLAARSIEIRSAGPDRKLFNEDDLFLSPGGDAL